MTTTPAQVDEQSVSLVTQARTLAGTLATREQYQQAQAMRQTIDQMATEVTAHHQPMIDAATESLARSREARDKYLKPLLEADRMLMTARANYAAEQQQLEDERRRAEDERRRKEVAEKARVLREQLEAQQRAERERIRQEEEARRIAAAEEAERRGAAEAEIQAALEQPMDTPMPDLMSNEEINSIVEAEQAMMLTPAPMVRTSPAVRYQYSAEVVSLDDLITAVAANRAPVTCLEPHMPTLNRLAAASKEGFQIPGCRLNKRPIDDRRRK